MLQFAEEAAGDHQSDRRGRQRRNAVNTMVRADVKGVQFIVANTEHAGPGPLARTVETPDRVEAHERAGRRGEPEIGRSAALEDAEKIKAVLAAPRWSITAGMGRRARARARRR
jgi:cell division protein FtsZ